MGDADINNLFTLAPSGIVRLSEFDQKLGNTRIHNGIVNLSCTWQTGQHENQKAQLLTPSLSF